MRQTRHNPPRKTQKISKLSVRNGTNDNRGKDLPAAVNPIRWQRFTTVELLQTPHDGGPSASCQAPARLLLRRHLGMKHKRPQTGKNRMVAIGSRMAKNCIER
ncbi:MAG: hypothetical protein DMG34_22700 [Acidobacteria bacterium]|nr:MAG: hypothetical protein DMG34_22700 [Acidobacteriota bacterium]